MRFSWQILKIVGIPVRIHATLLLLLGWVAVEEYLSLGDPFREVVFISAILICVLLHEFGHALAAKLFGIQTRDIVIYPFGGIATISSTGTPFAELIIAFAGPLVNVLIAAALSVLIDFSVPTDVLLAKPDLIIRLFFANCILVVFNMIPALPMDGGRVLRASLQLLKVQSATLISGRISQILSMLLFALAFWLSHPMLLIVAAIIFSQASAEISHFRALSFSGNLTVRDAMIRANLLTTFPHATTISEAFRSAITSLQPIFPVCHGDQVIGLLSREVLLETGAIESEDNYVSSIMERNFVSLPPSTLLRDVVAQVTDRPEQAYVVIEDGALIGMLFRDRLFEFLLLTGVRSKQQLFAQQEAERSY